MAEVHAPIPLDAAVRPRKSVGAWTLGIVLLTVTGVVATTVVTSPNVEWPVVREYVFSGQVLDGVWVTIELSILAMLLGVVLGLVIALLRVSDNLILRTIALAYLWVFRSVPLLVQLLIWFNLALLFPVISLGLPGGGSVASWQTNSLMTPFVAALLGLGLHEAAYASEIVRAGLDGVPKGQVEAARVLGLSPAKSLLYVVLPQAARIAIPPLGNQFIGMLKSSSLVAFIAGNDLLTVVQNIYSRNYQIIPLLMVASIWYAVVTTVASLGQGWIERRLSQRRGTRTRRDAMDGLLTSRESV
ncbi:amino acid ABC transporter permease [Actinomadura madurae]|uniref:amino acid ABC transporter permease n=1 Tax=Actinomadura madurae TaxID=1993 RepID=UPI0020273D65|nr:amino acid ABC transporter permease [Actinomadura madurae]MCP9951477.1 amino acid ABC transporter permease [Actinomadura madurae]MCP9968250.1 amino acid ABC transporter permease [Actinomadura madurae]MCP9980711.1 amino acid ABC transporter permease [Actinomadura madurae]MCQ0007782.1 amino acid ABC transporter permease [Actinomadura madurae]MCQ0016907.1 amino acid ABC transporter permease [Actinomadura madurae]